MKFRRNSYHSAPRIPLKKGDSIHVENSEIVVTRTTPNARDLKPKEVEVTDECITELKQSMVSSGHYVGIYHEGRQIFVLGVDDKSKAIPYRQGKYRLELAPGARVSFRIMMRK